MGTIERYIISFLLYGHEEAIDRVQLTGAVDWTLRYPNLSKTPTIERVRGVDEEHPCVKIDPELIYFTFFFISRAEELLNAQRDAYGRFLAAYSILGTNNHLQIPLIDEYARSMMKALNLQLPAATYERVTITHDIDTIALYRHLRGALGGIKRGQWRKVLASWKDIHQDPVYTFPWMIEQDKPWEVIYFVKHTSGKGLDYPQYALKGKDYRQLKNLLMDNSARLGIHSSAYEAYPLPKGLLHRSHYLACSIERMEQLVTAGYTDDYSMGFADQAGFRLLTTRPVRWINPKTMELTPLTLHPLTIMDCTLSHDAYMHLNEEEAYFYCQALISRVREHHGELVLLWHNSVFEEAYHRSLYPKILSLL